MNKKYRILLGSNNKHKREELQAILDYALPGKITLVSPNDIFTGEFKPREKGATLEENAMIKAKTFLELTALPTIADDTGLEIDALGGAPGVHSARFSGVQGADEQNRAKVLSLLESLPPENRTARFRTVICYADSNRIELIEGECRGKIIYSERGEGGFGYDCIFVPDGYEDTFAEMSAEEKNKISHRAHAANNLAEFLKQELL